MSASAGAKTPRIHGLLHVFRDMLTYCEHLVYTTQECLAVLFVSLHTKEITVVFEHNASRHRRGRAQSTEHRAQDLCTAEHSKATQLKGTNMSITINLIIGITR